MITRRATLGGLLASLAACGIRPPSPPPKATQTQIDALTRALLALGPTVDPEEASRAASLAFAQTHALALAYDITDPPLIHNAKVNAGRKPRGLCWHWAEDMEKRLQAENFQTLALHRAIANADSRILIDHSTAVISARGAPMQAGIVLDPWRQGGTLFWSPVASDKRYTWQLREEVLRKYGRIIYVNPDGSPSKQPQ